MPHVGLHCLPALLRFCTIHRGTLSATANTFLRNNIHLVGDNPELALLGVGALLQHIVDQRKELLHHSVLTHVIIARFDLQQARWHLSKLPCNSACCQMWCASLLQSLLPSLVADCVVSPMPHSEPMATIHECLYQQQPELRSELLCTLILTRTQGIKQV